MSALTCARCGAKLNPDRACYFTARRDYGTSQRGWLVALGAECARDVARTVLAGGAFRVTRSGMLRRVPGALEAKWRPSTPSSAASDAGKDGDR